MSHTTTARGLKVQSRNAIDKNILSVRQAHRNAQTKTEEDELSGILFDLIDQKERLLKKTLVNLDAKRNIGVLITQLKAATSDAKAEAKQISQTTASITELTTMLGNISRLVGLFVAL